MILVDLRNAIVSGIGTGISSLREVKSHGGRFTLSEIKAIAARSPSVRVACLGIPGIEQTSTCIQADVMWGAFVVCGDQAGAPRDSLALDLVTGLAAIIPTATWGLDESVDGASQVRADNLFSRDIDRIGVALWAVTWRHTVDIDPTDISSLNDFLRAYVDWDINQDGETDASDIISLPAD